MVEIGKSWLFSTLFIYKRKKKTYSAVWCFCLCSWLSLEINEWHVKLEFIEQKKNTDSISLFEYIVVFCYHLSDNVYRFANQKYLRHQSKMYRHHVYLTTILQRPLWNTSLQHVKHCNDPENKCKKLEKTINFLKVRIFDSILKMEQFQVIVHLVSHIIWFFPKIFFF